MKKPWTVELYEKGGIPRTLIRAAFETYFRSPIPNALEPPIPKPLLQEMFAALASGTEVLRDLVLYFVEPEGYKENAPFGNGPKNALAYTAHPNGMDPLFLALQASRHEEFRRAAYPSEFDYANFYALITAWCARVGALNDGVQSALLAVHSHSMRELLNDLKPVFASISKLKKKQEQQKVAVKKAQEQSKSSRRNRKRAWVDEATTEAVNIICAVGAIDGEDLFKRVGTKVSKAWRTVQTELPPLSHLRQLALLEVKKQRTRPDATPLR